MATNRDLERAWEAGKMYQSISGRVNVSPWEALLEGIQELTHMSQWLANQVDGYTEMLRQLEYGELPVPEGVGRQEFWAVLTETRRRHADDLRKSREATHKAASLAIKADLGERMVQDWESISRNVATALSDVLSAAELTNEQRILAQKAIPAAMSGLAETLRDRMIEGSSIDE